MNNISYKKYEEIYKKELVHIMKLAFEDDLIIHNQKIEDAPNGYDNGELLDKFVLNDEYKCEVIFIDEKVIGLYVVSNEEKNYTLELIYISPYLKSKGIGKDVFEYIQNKYNDANIWYVETPEYSERNNYFYMNKCGFKKIKQIVHSNGEISYLYKKENAKNSCK